MFLTVGATDEVEAEFLLDELEQRRHSLKIRTVTNRVRVNCESRAWILRFAQNDSATGSIHGVEWRIN